MKRFLLFLFVFCLGFSGAAQAEPKPLSIVLIYETGGKETDKAFIDMAKTGASKAQRDLNITYQEYTIGDNEEREEVFRRFAGYGTNLIIALGFQNVSTVLDVAEDYPNTRFTVIDGMIPPLFSNVQSIVFRDNEGAFIIGVIAANQSRSGKIGFIGGMDVPVIRDFAYGYVQGAEYANPKIQVLRDMIGTTKEAWSNPQKAAELAQKQIDQGVDVIFAAAGGSSIGMLEQVTHYPDVFSIGVDTNQNSLFPGKVLTSLVKRVDVVVYEAIRQMLDNSWQPGIKYMGINEGALDYAVDKYNKDLLPISIINEAERAKDLILQGIIKVDNYRPK
jgi:basic membrane protein A and related proteins